MNLPTLACLIKKIIPKDIYFYLISYLTLSLFFNEKNPGRHLLGTLRLLGRLEYVFAN